jgi:type I restriction enzyme S subunit
MKTGWERSTIGNFCEVIAGQSPEGKYYNADGIGLPFYQGKKDFGEKFIKAPTTWTSETTKTARKDDILMSVRAPVGPINFATEEICIGRGLAAIRSKDQLDCDFLFYQLLHLQPEIAGKEGAVFASINKSEIAALPISVGPLPEQHHIVAILDEAFDGIATAKANAEKNLQNARALFESHLQSVFTERGEGWVETTVGDQLTLQRGFDITKSQQGEGDVPVVSSGGIKSFHETSMAMAPGVVIGRKGTLGKCFFIDRDYWPHDTTLWVKDFKGNAPRFVYYLLLGLGVKHLDTGTANPALNRNQVHPIKISWPPAVSKQQELIQRFDSLSEETQRLESLFQQKLTALDDLKKSLLHQAFSGQL